MRKLITVSIFFTFLSVSLYSFADSLTPNTWEMGTEISHITYKEPDVMEEKGMMYGLAGSYTYHDSFMFKIDGKSSYGSVDYTSQDTGTIDAIDDYMLELRTVGGYDFNITDTTTITPYLGIGYRYLNDDSKGMVSSTNALGYERESNYYYSPIGILAVNEFDNNEWSIGLTTEYDHFWKGKQISHLSDVDLGYSDLKNDQNEGFGCRGSIQIIKRDENIDFMIEPFIRYWDIKKSKIADITYNGVLYAYAWEPKNNSTEIGIKIAARF